MELCECEHYHAVLPPIGKVTLDLGCSQRCGCPAYKPRHDPRYDPDDAHDIGYRDEGFPYSGLGKVRR